MHCITAYIIHFNNNALQRPILIAKQASGAQLAKHLVESELRWAPSGPDPMHHHASPKRPQAP